MLNPTSATIATSETIATRKTTATTIDLVRHGEVQTPGLFCASANEPLSDKGWAQLNRLKGTPNWTQIITSPQRRCHEFAGQLAQQQNAPLSIDKQWREMNFGRWTGRPYQAVWGEDHELLMQLWKTPLDFTAPGGESMNAFVTRIQSAWAALLASHQGETVLLLTHAGVIRIILATVLEISYQNTQKFSVAHAKINRIRCYADGEVSLLNWGCGLESLAKE